MSKTLFIDIETSPNEGSAWTIYDTNLMWPLKKHWEIISYSARWDGDVRIVTKARDNYTEVELLYGIWDLLDKAKTVVAHNGDGFDLRKINTRMLVYGLMPPSEYRTVDTLKVCKRVFGFSSNKLDHVCQQLGIGKKMRTTPGLWDMCLAGDKKAWAEMKKYNAHDIVLLEGLYNRILPWIGKHPLPIREKERKVLQSA